MAGILANSSSHSMVSGSADNTQSGYVTGEQITLSTTPTGASYQWALSLPSGASPTRSALDSVSGATPHFTPDVGGYYVITCTVGGSTSYVLRLYVAQAASAVPAGAVNYAPIADAAVPTPTLGATLYYSSDQSAMTLKYPDGSKKTLNTTSVP